MFTLMGGWSYIFPHLHRLLNASLKKMCMLCPLAERSSHVTLRLHGELSTLL